MEATHEAGADPLLRAAKEGEGTGELEAPVQAEWRQDLEDNVDETQRLGRDVLGPAVLDGTLPPLNFPHPLCPSIDSMTRVGRTAAESGAGLGTRARTHLGVHGAFPS